MKYREFLKAVAERGGPTEPAHADQAAKAVLAALGQRLAGGKPKDLASQLPLELQETLTAHSGEPDIGDDVEDFCRRVVEREGWNCTPGEALTHAQAVFGTIATLVSAGEIEDLKSQLPAGYAAPFARAA
jgi:uncharacterized protein (DUF2267 family)